MESKLFGALDARLVEQTNGLAVIAPAAGGLCPMRDVEGCALHRLLGRKGKPRACWRFPFGLVATPAGGRITTSHLCTCRSVGSPPIALDEAEAALGDVKGRLIADTRVTTSLPIRDDRVEPYEAYVQREEELIARLLGGSDARTVIETFEPARIDPARLAPLARALVQAPWQTRGGAMLGWLGAGILRLVGERGGLEPQRPWLDSFARARIRVPEPQPASTIFADWAADAIWDLEWSFRGTLERGLGEIATLLDIGHALVETLEPEHGRADLAAAEAVAVLDLARRSDPWRAALSAAFE